MKTKVWASYAPSCSLFSLWFLGINLITVYVILGHFKPWRCLLWLCSFFTLPEGFQRQSVNKAPVRSEGLNFNTEAEKVIFERFLPVIFKYLVFLEDRQCLWNGNFVVRELHGILQSTFLPSDIYFFQFVLNFPVLLFVYPQLWALTTSAFLSPHREGIFSAVQCIFFSFELWFLYFQLYFLVSNYIILLSWCLLPSDVCSCLLCLPLFPNLITALNYLYLSF